MQEARDLLEQGVYVPVRLLPETNNPVDPKAIAFQCEVNDKYHMIGYVVKEAVHDALHRSEKTSVEFKWIKYVSDWYRSVPGYFAGINVTKIGTWPHSVVWVSSAR